MILGMDVIITMMALNIVYALVLLLRTWEDRRKEEREEEEDRWID